MHYLMVVRVPSRRVGPQKVALESAFREHLIKLRESFEGRITRFTVVVPTMSEERYRRDADSLSVIDEANDGFDFVLMHPEGCGMIRYNFLELPRNAVRMWSAIRDADLVHSGRDHPTNVFNFVGSVCAVLRRKPLVFVVDIDNRPSAKMSFRSGCSSRKGYLLEQYFFTPLVNWQIRFASRYAKLLLVKGNALARDFSGSRATVHSFINVVHDSEMVIDSANLLLKHTRQRAASDPIKAVYFGRIVRYKGIDHALRAIAKCMKNGTPIRLEVVGNGPDLGRLQSLSHELGVQDFVSFRPAMPYSRCLESIRDSDILLATPLSSDTPRSLFDAMSQGLVTVAYSTPYYDDFDSQCGVVICPWNDPDSLADAILRLNADREQLTHLSAQAVQFARDNTQQVWVERRARWTQECLPQA